MSAWRSNPGGARLKARIRAPLCRLCRTASLGFLFRRVAPLVLAVFVVLPGRGWAFESTASVPFGGSVSKENALVIATAAASAAVCQKGADAIGARPLAFFAARTPERRLALATALMDREECGRLAQEGETPPRVSITMCGWLPLPENAPAAKSNTEEAVAVPPDLFERQVKEMLAVRGWLDFYEALAGRRALLAGEALILAGDAGAVFARRGAEADAPQSPRLLRLARGLEALDLFERCLPLFNGVWAAPEMVVRDMERATELDGGVPFFWTVLGEALFQTGRNRRAIEALDRAVELAPEAARPRHSRGIVYLGMSSVPLAEQDLSAALRLDPENPEYWQSRGALRARQGEHEGMCGDFLNACRLGLCDAYGNALRNGWCLAAEAHGAGRAEHEAASAEEGGVDEAATEASAEAETETATEAEGEAAP